MEPSSHGHTNRLRRPWPDDGHAHMVPTSARAGRSWTRGPDSPTSEIHHGGVRLRARDVRPSRRGIAATSIALLAVAAISPGVLAQGFWPAQTLAAGVHWATARDMAYRGDTIAVVWTEQAVDLPPDAHVRWSLDEGATFEPEQALPARRGPTVAVCAGHVWVASDTEADRVVLDTWALDGTGFRHRQLPPHTSGSDIACMGDSAVAVSFAKGVARPTANLHVWRFTPGTSHVEGEDSYAFDHTPEPTGRTVIAATRSDLYVAWTNGHRLSVKHGVLTLTDGVAMRGRKVVLDAPVDGFAIAADGKRVVVAYGRAGRVRILSSRDRGLHHVRGATNRDVHLHGQPSPRRTGRPERLRGQGARGGQIMAQARRGSRAVRVRDHRVHHLPGR